MSRGNVAKAGTKIDEIEDRADEKIEHVEAKLSDEELEALTAPDKPEAPQGYAFCVVCGPGVLMHNGTVFVPGDEVLLPLNTIAEIAPVVALKG